MTKFKVKHSCKQYWKLKAVKREFKWQRRFSRSGYLYETLPWEEKRNRLQSWWKCCVKSLTISEMPIAHCILTIFLIALLWWQSYLMMEYMVLVQFDQIAKWYENSLIIKAWSEVTFISNTPKKWFVPSGKITMV